MNYESNNWFKTYYSFAKNIFIFNYKLLCVAQTVSSRFSILGQQTIHAYFVIFTKTAQTK